MITAAIDTDLPERIAAAQVAVADWPTAWRALRPQWHDSRRELIDSRGAAAGTSWTWPARYITAKARITGTPIGSHPMAWPGRTPILRPSLTAQSSHEVWRESDEDVVIGTQAPQADDLMRGAPLPDWAGAGTAPAYDLLADTRRWTAARQAEIDAHAKRVATALGGQ